MRSGTPGRIAVLGCLVLTSASAQPADDTPDPVIYSRIRDEGTARSRVMEYTSELMDEIGPRLTGSPNLERATDWAMRRLRDAGASNVVKESWGEFGMGWRQRNVWVRIVAPTEATVIATAAPWSPATRGTVSGVVVPAAINDDKAFEPYRGKLRDRIVLLGRAPSMPVAPPIDKPLFDRLDEVQLAELERAVGTTTVEDPLILERTFAAGEFGERIGRFFADEGVRAVIVPSANNARGGASGGTIYADWNYTLGFYTYLRSRTMRVPLVIVAVEDYLRLSRLLERKTTVRVELNVDVTFTGDRVEGFNVIAEIPGVDPRRGAEAVMMTAHLDSWAAGTGATDDGAGVVVAIEAMRILKALGVQPARTIRVALWTGEEQGMLGSVGYVKRHVADVPRATTPEQMRVPEAMRRVTGPVVPKADHARLSAVYTLDMGGGRIRAIAVDGNAALVPIFQQWIAPLKDMGVNVVTLRPYCPGDCRPFAQAGIPTPGFIQDPLEYDTRTHHTNSDTYERLVPEDLRQAAIVTAAMLHNTAMRGEMLPRK